MPPEIRDLKVPLWTFEELRLFTIIGNVYFVISSEFNLWHLHPMLNTIHIFWPIWLPVSIFYYFVISSLLWEKDVWGNKWVSFDLNVFKSVIFPFISPNLNPSLLEELRATIFVNGKGLNSSSTNIDYLLLKPILRL